MTEELNAQAAVLLVDKAQGWTSHDVAAYVRSALKVKTGHSGTLDPMATGLLILLLGRATKLQESYQKMPKTYYAEVTLGTETDTWDAEGEPLRTVSIKPITLQDVHEALNTMTGEITHPVPYYSAKKINGKAMYKEARKGNHIERESTVTIYKWENVTLEGNKITFDVTCGSGTYVRSLAYMLALKLGTVGHISALRRTSIGGYDVKDSIPIETIKTTAREEILKCVKIL